VKRALAVCLLFATLGGLTCVSSPLRAQNPLNSYPLGFEFADTLEDAQSRAATEGRILMLVPSALRTSTASNDLGPATEAFRAGPLVDDRVVRLIQRRVVAYGFDMDRQGARYDEDAAAIAISICPDLKFPSIMPAAPILFITPDGTELGQIDFFCTPDAFLEVLTAVVSGNVAYNELTAAEAALEDPTARARVLYDLRQFDRCLALVEDDQSSEAYFLRGAIARERGEWADMKAAFKMVSDERRKPDIQMHEILRFWEIGNFEGIKSIVTGLNRRFPHYQQAMYYLGLAMYHTGETEEAAKVWEDAILADPESAWALRLDWTRGLAKSGADSPMLSRNSQDSLLKRKYLSPQGNADLKRE
jgi:hypothetical protein